MRCREQRAQTSAREFAKTQFAQMEQNTGTPDRANGPRGSALTAVCVHSKRMGEGVLSAFMLGMEWAVWNAFPFCYSVSCNGHHVRDALHRGSGTEGVY
jgi:hypothetical protein